MLPLKPIPAPSLTLVGRPEKDHEYRHFEHAAEVPFDAAAFGLSPRNAWWLADAALLSYWPPDEASLIFRDAAGLQSEYVSDEGTECYVAWNDTAAIVAFRGTQPNQPLDIWADIDAALVTWLSPSERVHEGFRNALTEVVVGRITARLSKLPGRSVWLTGHSLGGALATLFADRVPSFSGLCTFGSPRVGDAAFADGFARRHTGRSFRYVNNRDVVTRVPALDLFGAHYAHVIRELRIGADGRIEDVPAGAPPTSTGEAIDALRPTASLVGPVIDHTPRRYAVLVWNALAAAMAASAEPTAPPDARAISGT
jgi:triacylglycerol lipase